MQDFGAEHSLNSRPYVTTHISRPPSSAGQRPRGPPIRGRGGLRGRRRHPLQRLATPEEVADAVLFLASSEPWYITGATHPSTAATPPSSSGPRGSQRQKKDTP
ncbi:SDR family oxidoreductase [Streptomyces sp. NPDC015127]|uniref:SDR family oxidoreductase n=1 Tax=Streptomyces sp. NPDC015127 TaxID=3364939 RepID=UPI0036F676DD